MKDPRTPTKTSSVKILVSIFLIVKEGTQRGKIGRQLLCMLYILLVVCLCHHRAREDRNDSDVVAVRG